MFMSILIKMTIDTIIQCISILNLINIPQKSKYNQSEILNIADLMNNYLSYSSNFTMHYFTNPANVFGGLFLMLPSL